MTRVIRDTAELLPGECGTVDGRRVYLRCADCGALLSLGRIWAVGQTVDDVRDFGMRPCCSEADRALLDR